VDGRWTGLGGQITFLELSVVPLLDAAAAPLGVSIHFVDVTRQRRLQEEVHRVSQELETALEELQCTNEELETTNEELQSTNEELQTINEEARDRGDQLAELNSFLESILTSLRSAVAVVDRDLHVRKWSRRAEDLWGLRADEVLLKNFLNLDIGLPVERLRAPIRACLSGESDFVDVTLDATNRRGRPIQVRVSCTPLSAGSADDSRGVILLMEETDRAA
jgi:two-component system CheB/CheR fusion protein